jgi:hypothetical protein
MLRNFVVSINEVGLSVGLSFQPVTVLPVSATWQRMQCSIRRQIRREIRSTKPSTSMRWFFFKKMLLTITGSFKKLKLRSIPSWSLYSRNSSWAQKFSRSLALLRFEIRTKQPACRRSGSTFSVSGVIFRCN